MVKSWFRVLARWRRDTVEWLLVPSEIGVPERLHTFFLFVGVAVLYGFFFFTPVNPTEGDQDLGVVALLIGIVYAFLGVVILSSAFLSAYLADRIGPRAVARFVAAMLWYIILFTTVYYILSVANRSCFNEPLGRGDAIYLVMSVLTTTDFGDVRPVEDLCRSLVALQMILNFALISGALVVLVTRSSARRDEWRTRRQ